MSKVLADALNDMGAEVVTAMPMRQSGGKEAQMSGLKQAIGVESNVEKMDVTQSVPTNLVGAHDEPHQ